MNEMDAKTIKDLVGVIKGTKSGTSPYDTTATVIRVENGIAWVHIPGGIEETPAALTINAKQGDTVRVRVANGQAWLTGSDSAPPTDDRMANLAQNTAAEARETANTAQESVGKAEKAAETAQRSADAAIEDAATANTAARRAQTAAETAQTAAAQAQSDAASASASAATANTAANSALTQLSVVEDVVDTLAWISEHGEYALTEDTAVQDGKTYYTRSGSEGAYQYAVVVNPEENPASAGYYELTGVDEAVSNFIATHLAMTNEGLYVLMDDTGYKLKVTASGMYVIDQAGAEVAAYSENTRIGQASGRHVNIGDESVEVKDGANVLASFGETTTIGSINGSHIDITGGRVSFKLDAQTEVAYIATNEDGESVFYMTKAIVVQDLLFGKWQWKTRDNDNLVLKWMGSEE